MTVRLKCTHTHFIGARCQPKALSKTKLILDQYWKVRQRIYPKTKTFFFVCQRKTKQISVLSIILENKKRKICDAAQIEEEDSAKKGSESRLKSK